MDRYEILEKIGNGAYGTVYKAVLKSNKSSSTDEKGVVSDSMNDSFQKSERPFSTETIIPKFLEPSNYIEDGSFSLLSRKVVVMVNPRGERLHIPSIVENSIVF